MARAPKLLTRLATSVEALPRAARVEGNPRTLTQRLVEFSREAVAQLRTVASDPGLNERGVAQHSAARSATLRKQLDEMRQRFIGDETRDPAGIRRIAERARGDFLTRARHVLDSLPLADAVAAAVLLPRIAGQKAEALAPLIEGAERVGDVATLRALSRAPVLADVPDGVRALAKDAALRAAAPDEHREYVAAQAMVDELVGAFDQLARDLDDVIDGAASIDGPPSLEDQAAARARDALRRELGPLPDGVDLEPVADDVTGVEPTGMDRVQRERERQRREAASAAGA